MVKYNLSSKRYIFQPTKTIMIAKFEEVETVTV